MIEGLDEFREHLGGELTVTLAREPGRGREVHELDERVIRASLRWLQSARDDARRSR